MAMAQWTEEKRESRKNWYKKNLITENVKDTGFVQFIKQSFIALLDDVISAWNQDKR